MDQCNLIEKRKIQFVMEIGNREEKYGIQPIEEIDLPILLEWRNSPRINKMMFTDHSISWEEHKAWFQRISTFKTALHFIFFYNDIPIGYIGYSNLNWNDRTCQPGSYIGNVDVPIVAGIVLGYFSGQYAFSVLGMEKLYVHVLADNKRAIRMLQRYGSAKVSCLKQHVLKNGEYHDVVSYVSYPTVIDAYYKELKKYLF